MAGCTYSGGGRLHREGTQSREGRQATEGCQLKVWVSPKCACHSPNPTREVTGGGSLRGDQDQVRTRGRNPHNAVCVLSRVT